jgi:hypothetical protein
MTRLEPEWLTETDSRLMGTFLEARTDQLALTRVPWNRVTRIATRVVPPWSSSVGRGLTVAIPHVMTRKKGRGLLLAVSGVLLVGATAGCPQPGDGCFCGNAASVCHFADGTVCMDLNPADAGATDAGADGGQDAGR